ncbi:MAG: hypothetical protein AB7N76_08220 [Planctomycetota bacterium]
MRRATYVFVPLALAVGVVLASLGGAGAKDRDEDCPPWARELLRELREQRAATPERYKLVSHSGKRTVVFDGATGRLYELDEKQVREVAAPEGQVRVRAVVTQDESMGGVIRPR